MAKRARQAAEKAVALAPNRPEGYQALGTYERIVAVDYGRALEQYEKGLRVAPSDASLVSGTALAELGLGRWDAALEHLSQAERLDPRSVERSAASRRRASPAEALSRGPGSYRPRPRPLARQPRSDRAKAMTFLGEGNLRRCSGRARGRAREVEPTALVAYVANYWDLVWVLDEEQRELLLRLTPGAFDDDRGTWAICLAQAYALEGRCPTCAPTPRRQARPSRSSSARSR